MKHFLTILCVFALLHSYGQNEWKLVNEKDGVSFYQKTVECADVQENFFQNSVLLKIENSNKKAVRVTWQNHTFYNGECADCESLKHINIGGKDSKEGDCNIYSAQNQLRIFHSWTKKDNEVVLDDFKVNVIAIETIKNSEL